MKGLLLAGGSGTRLWPSTLAVSKQLLPIYDKPMIYYPLTTLMLAGVQEIALVTTSEQQYLYKNLLVNSDQWGIKIHYVVQDIPTGIPDALRLVPKSFKDESLLMVLGDNFVYGVGLGRSLKSVFTGQGAVIFGHKVVNPQAYGVVEFDSNGFATNIQEKPTVPKSNFAIPGIYYMDSECYKHCLKLLPSKRGETEITDLLKLYLRQKKLKVKTLERGTAWLDTGTYDNLLAASEFVRAIESRQGLKIGCPEEVALREKFISKNQFMSLLNLIPRGEYYEYLNNLEV